jgi:hypothetical protein
MELSQTSAATVAGVEGADTEYVGVSGTATGFAFALALLLSGLNLRQGASSKHSRIWPNIFSQSFRGMPRLKAIFSKGSVKYV